MRNFGLVREGVGRAVVKPVPIPKLRDDYILVRTVAIALNPTDWTTIDAKGDDGTIVGCDYAGVVEAVGPAVTKDLKQGDRVAGMAHGANDANSEDGAFAEVITVKGDLQIRIPDGVSFEAAATAGAGIATIGYALYKVLGLPFPDQVPTSREEPILVYGGSTASGTLAVQFAKMSGRRVITTCSPKHFELLKSRGADQHLSDVGERIRAVTNGKLTTVFDTVALETTSAICAKAFGPDGGKYCSLLPVDFPRSDVESVFFLGYDMGGEPYVFEGEEYPAKPDDFKFAVDWCKNAEKLWAQGKWMNHPEAIRPGGLSGAIEGMQEGREGKISGVKLVYRVDETNWPTL